MNKSESIQVHQLISNSLEPKQETMLFGQLPSVANLIMQTGKKIQKAQGRAQSTHQDKRCAALFIVVF